VKKSESGEGRASVARRLEAARVKKETLRSGELSSATFLLEIATIAQSAPRDDLYFASGGSLYLWKIARFGAGVSSGAHRR
jgi:hypothetical protein